MRSWHNSVPPCLRNEPIYTPQPRTEDVRGNRNNCTLSSYTCISSLSFLDKLKQDRLEVRKVLSEEDDNKDQGFLVTSSPTAPKALRLRLWGYLSGESLIPRIFQSILLTNHPVRKYLPGFNYVPGIWVAILNVHQSCRGNLITNVQPRKFQ